MAHSNTRSSAIDAVSRLTAEPFFGRTAILAALRRILEATSAGRGHGLLIAGEAGTGKTRIADRANEIADAIGVRTISVRSHLLDGAPALRPWIEVARQLLAQLGDAERAAFLQEHGRPLASLTRRNEDAPMDSSRADESGSSDRYALFDAMTRLLDRVAADTPLLITLDDLHWSDPASVLLAHFATRELRRSPVVLLGLYRDTEVTANDPLGRALEAWGAESERFGLAGFAPDETTRFVEHVAGFEVSKTLTAALQAQTGGNPFFLTEILRLLLQENGLGGPNRPTPEAIPLPDSVRHVLERRLESLPPSTQAMLRLAAVIGTDFEFEMLAACLADEDREAPPTSTSERINEALDDAIDARVVGPRSEEVGRYRFVHDLIRETLIAMTPSAERSRLHTRVAEAIVRVRSTQLKDHYATLSFHYAESAAAGGASKAVEYSIRGAEQATAHSSFELAATLYERALRSLDLQDASSNRSPEDSQARRGMLLIELGNALWQSGRRDDAERRHRAAEAIARQRHDPELLARAAIGLAGRNDLPMDYPDASARLLEEAVDSLPATDSRLRVRLLAHLVRATHAGAGRDRLSAWASEACEIAERIGTPDLLFAARESLHYALLMPDQLGERLRVSQSLPELARETGSLRLEALAWLWRAYDLSLVPDLAGVDASIRQFERATAALRQPFYDWLAVGLRATRAQMGGHLEEVERLVFEALEVGQRADTPNALLFFGTQLFHLREEQGRSDELLPVMQKIVEERPSLIVFRIGIPLIHALAGRELDARRTFDQVALHDFEDVPHDLHRLPMLTTAGCVCAYLGDSRRAELLLEQLRPLSGTIVMGGVMTYWGGSTDRAIGLLEESLGRFDAAEQKLGAAAEVAAQAGARLIEAHCLTERARVLRRLGTEDATVRASRAEERAHGLYLERGIERPFAVLQPRSDEHATPRRADRSARPRERQAGTFRRAHSKWHLEFDDAAITLPDSKGLAYLQRLVGRPDVDVHVLDLVSYEAPPADSVHSETTTKRPSDDPARLVESSLESLDHTAAGAYRARLRELQDLRRRAEVDHDLALQAALDRERQSIERELESAYGLGGRERGSKGVAERARKAVYNRIRGSIRRIENEHPALGRHLERSIQTGTLCVYRPEIEIDWSLD